MKKIENTDYTNLSLHDWCIQLDKSSKDVKKYETQIKKLYNILKMKYDFDTP